MESIVKYARRHRCLMLSVTGTFGSQIIHESMQLLKCDEILQIKQEFDTVVFELAECQDYDYNVARAVMQLNAHLKEEKKQLRIAHPSRDFARFVADNGLTSVFRVLETDVAVSARRIDVNFVNPFIESALETMKIQCSMPATAGKPFLRTNGFEDGSDIVGVIELESATFTGAIALCFPESTFLALMSGMLGESCEAINPELEDGAGELLNIIFGQVRMKLREHNYEVARAIPSVVRGTVGEIKTVTPEPSVIVPFATEKGSFHIRIGIQ